MDTKDALLDSAEMLARSRGFDAFSYADLSKDVGIRKASIHHHFPGKADLALALIDRYDDRFQQELDHLNKRHARAGDRLLGYLGLYRNALKGGEQLCLCVAYSAGRDSFTPEVLARLEVFHSAGIAWLTAVFSMHDGSIANVTDPKAEARATLAMVEGAQLMARAAKDITLFDAATDALKTRVT